MLRIIRCIGRACRLRALAAVLTVVPLLVASTATHAAYPDRVDHADRAVRRRWADRHHRAHRLARLPEIARTVGGRRKPGRRRRQYRHDDRGARRARRLHAAADARPRSRSTRRCSRIWPTIRSRTSRRSPNSSTRPTCSSCGPIPASTRSPISSRARRPHRARSTTRAPARAPSRISPASSSSCAPASTWCTCRIAAPVRRRWRCWRARCRSARWRLAAAEPLDQGRPAQGARGDRRERAGSRCRTCRP